MKKIALSLIASCFSLFVTAAHAGESDITRDTIQITSPVAFDALLTLEQAQGTRIADSDLRRVLKSPEFNQQYQIELRKFCGAVANANNYLCVVTAADRVGQVPAVSVTIQDASLKSIPDHDLGKLLDSLLNVAIVIPTTANQYAYLAVKQEVFDRASTKASEHASDLTKGN